ncbi:MAG: TonB family protein [Kofleriaceae bacterium]
MERLLISGASIIDPDPHVMREIKQRGRTMTVSTTKVCIDEKGHVSNVVLLKSSGFPDYDAKLLRALRARRYRPFKLSGVAKKVCSSWTTIFRLEDHPVIATRHPSGFGMYFEGSTLYADASGPPVPRQIPAAALIQVSTPEAREPLENEPHALFLKTEAYSLELWAKAEDMGLIAREDVLLAGTPRKAGVPTLETTPGIRLRAGAPVVVQGRKGSALLVRLVGSPESSAGWVPAKLVGRVARLPKPPSADEHEGAKLRITNQGLRDGPIRGRALTPPQAGQVVTPHGADMVRVAVLEERGDQALVKHDDDQWWMIGWTPLDGLEPDKAEATQPMRIGGTAPEVLIPEGTDLLATPDGPIIGRANRERSEVFHDSSAPYYKIFIHTELGAIAAWAAGEVAPQEPREVDED